MRKKRQKLLLIAASAFGALLIAGLLAWWFREPLLSLLPTPPVVITESANGSTVHLLQGQKLEVRLPANRLKGQHWQLGIEVPFLEQQGDPTFTESPSPSRPGEGYQSTTFRAINPGTGPLFMDVRSDSDPTSFEPSKAFSVVVVVR